MPPDNATKLLIPDEEVIDTIIRQVAREEILSRYQSLKNVRWEGAYRAKLGECGSYFFLLLPKNEAWLLSYQIKYTKNQYFDLLSTITAFTSQGQCHRKGVSRR